MSAPDPGLDMAALRAVRASRTAPNDTPHLLRRISDHLEAHQGYVSLSGGKDSVAVLHLARQVDPQVPVAFFNSGLEYPETIAYISELTQMWDLNLHVYEVSPSLLEVLAASGDWHLHQQVQVTPDLFDLVVARPAAAAHAHHGPGVLWGVRSAESNGRRIAHARALAAVDCPAHTSAGQRRLWHGGTISRVDGTTAYSPIWDWPTRRVWDYLAAHEVPVNPVYAKLEAAGAPPASMRLTAMIDGVGLDGGRLVWLQRGWPDLFNALAEVLPRIRDNT